MMLIHSSLALSLIALVFGASFLIYIKSHEKLKNIWNYFVSYLVIILSLISIICSIYFAFMKPTRVMHMPYMQEMPKEMKK